jgi:hypothetical protein
MTSIQSIQVIDVTNEYLPSMSEAKEPFINARLIRLIAAPAGLIAAPYTDQLSRAEKADKAEFDKR